MTAPTYYNDNDTFVAEWLRNLIAAGHLPGGDVDERPIEEVSSDDLTGYRACHWFAGIGGWPLALRLAGWPDDRPVWTGSCPCQPFSAAGGRRGVGDGRHLWPAFRALIAECCPPTVFGEQVASALGRRWLAAVRADLEALGYAVGAADLCAAGVGAPHIRQRLWWVADSGGQRRQQNAGGSLGNEAPNGRAGRIGGESHGHNVVAGHGEGGGLADADGRKRRGEWVRETVDGPRERTATGHGGWGDPAWLPCLDGKSRPTQPGVHPLAHGVSGRVGQLRAYGNAIVPQVAARFVMAWMECRP